MPGGVVAAGGRAEEAELGGLADDQAELGAGDVGLGPFLHAHRHDAEGLDRRRHARDGRGRGLDADVIGPRHAAADPDPLAAADQAVIGRAEGDGEVEVGRSRGAGPACPAQAERTSTTRCRSSAGLEDAAVEQDGRGRDDRVRRCGASRPAGSRNRARWRVIAGSAA